MGHRLFCMCQTSRRDRDPGVSEKLRYPPQVLGARSEAPGNTCHGIPVPAEDQNRQMAAAVGDTGKPGDPGPQLRLRPGVGNDFCGKPGSIRQVVLIKDHGTPALPLLPQQRRQGDRQRDQHPAPGLHNTAEKSPYQSQEQGKHHEYQTAGGLGFQLQGLPQRTSFCGTGPAKAGPVVVYFISSHTRSV